jgi:hypothetical protein
MAKKNEKNPHAVALGRKGGRARMDKLTVEQRRDIARNAAKVRWANTKNRKKESI